MSLHQRQKPNEDWQSTQETFATYLKNQVLSAPCLAPWIERMIVRYEARGQHDEAWTLTQRIFHAYLQKYSLSTPRLSPWIERMIVGYECRGQHNEACDLFRKASDPESPHRTDSGLLSKLCSAYRDSATEGPLLNRISRLKRLRLLTNPMLSTDLRRLVSKSLLADSCIPLEIGSGVISIQWDVLCFWSNYFAGAQYNGWDIEDPPYGLDQFPTDAVERIFKDYFYSGTYAEYDPAKKEMDRSIAERYGIESLLQSI